MLGKSVRKVRYNGLQGDEDGKRTGKSLTTIPINHIFFLAKLFCKERNSRKPKKGRSLTYSEFSS
jgi:hypothetical protein